MGRKRMTDEALAARLAAERKLAERTEESADYRKASHTAWYLKHRDEQLAREKAAREAGRLAPLTEEERKERALARQRRQEARQEKERARSRERYERLRGDEAFLQANRDNAKDYYRRNREEVLARSKRRYEEHREEILAKAKVRYRLGAEAMLRMRLAAKAACDTCAAEEACPCVE